MFRIDLLDAEIFRTIFARVLATVWLVSLAAVVVHIGCQIYARLQMTFLFCIMICWLLNERVRLLMR